ncbi:MAG: hypothetical protein ABFD98_15255 [Syntrophobacteraceae bacterium]|nr:hypothetical protein [Desulfobacteraceae bacterium]
MQIDHRHSHVDARYEALVSDREFMVNMTTGEGKCNRPDGGTFPEFSPETSRDTGRSRFQGKSTAFEKKKGRRWKKRRLHEALTNGC